MRRPGSLPPTPTLSCCSTSCPRRAAWAGWHKTKKLKWPANISPLFIPAGCPELNAAENIWQYLRQTSLSNRVFANDEAILDAASDAWNRLLAEGGRITSIATRDWAVAAR